MAKKGVKKKNGTCKEAPSKTLPEESKAQDGSKPDFLTQHQGPLILLKFTTPKAQHQALARMESFYESNKESRTYINLQDTATKSLCRNYQAFNLPVSAICEWLQAMRISESPLQETSGNIPQGWWRSFTTPQEACVLRHLSQVGCFKSPTSGEAPSYLISVTEASAIPHEALHALYFLHPGYKEKAQQVWMGLSQKCQAVISQDFTLRGYGEHVWVDEFQAYVSEDHGEFGNKARQECSDAKGSLIKAQGAAWKELDMNIGAFLKGEEGTW